MANFKWQIRGEETSFHFNHVLKQEGICRNLMKYRHVPHTSFLKNEEF